MFTYNFITSFQFMNFQYLYLSYHQNFEMKTGTWAIKVVIFIKMYDRLFRYSLFHFCHFRSIVKFVLSPTDINSKLLNPQADSNALQSFNQMVKSYTRCKSPTLLTSWGNLLSSKESLSASMNTHQFETRWTSCSILAAPARGALTSPFSVFYLYCIRPRADGGKIKFVVLNPRWPPGCPAARPVNHKKPEVKQEPLLRPF
jgi:hypothetical protein